MSPLKQFIRFILINAVRLNLIIIIAGCSQQQPEELTRQTHTDNGAYAADLSYTGLYAAISTNQGITLWDTEKRLPRFVWQQTPNEQNQVHIVKISADNRYVLTANKQNFAVWNVNTGANVGFYSINESTIAVADIANQAQFVVLGLLNGQIIHINLNTGRRLAFLAHTDRISTLAMSANGQYVLSGSYDGLALLWNSQTAQVVYRFEHQGRISQVALDKHARYAFTANSTNQSWIWDLTTGQKISALAYRARQQIFTSVQFSQNAKWLATGSPNQKVKLWSVQTGKLIAEWPFESDHFASTVLDFAFSLDDKKLAAETSYGLLQQWDISQLTN